MTIITLVFYQFPVALHELEAWEKTQKLQKNVIDDQGRIVYSVYDKKNAHEFYEKLYCFDINNFTLEEIDNVFITQNNIRENKHSIYKKTLVFGKVTLSNSIKLQQVLKKLESVED